MIDRAMPARRAPPFRPWAYLWRVVSGGGGLKGLLIQIMLVVIIMWIGFEFAANAIVHFAGQGISTGFGFLGNVSGFEVNQSLIAYSRADTYGRVLLVGLLNTLLVSVVSIVFATLLGFVIGIGRLSQNALISRLSGFYVELVRNLPLLFQILFWYLAVLGTLPGPRASLVLPGGIFLNNRGFIVPRPDMLGGFWPFAAALIAGLCLWIVLSLLARRRLLKTGQVMRIWPYLPIVFLVPLALALILFGPPLAFTAPELKGFNFSGGLRLIPELVALTIALSTYTAAFIAENVRSGLQSVARGQREAGASLGLPRGQILRQIVLPQAMRVILPPLTNQYLNLTKNSSLAVAIGYPDLFAVFAGTSLTQTGQAIEIIAITMAIYLALSLITSLAMNIYGWRLNRIYRGA